MGVGDEMKIKQINKQVIDWYDAQRKGRGRFAGFTVKDKVFVTDGYLIYVLKDEDCYFDVKKAKEVNLVDILENLGTDELINSNKILNDDTRLKGGNRLINLYVYQDDKNTTVGIDSKFLKHFENYTLKSIKGKNDMPVGIFEEDELVGIVFPVRLVDKDD